MGRFATERVATFPSAVSPEQDGNAAMAAWLAERCGKLTCSRLKDAIAFRKDGKPTQARSDLMRDILAERLTEVSTRHFVTPAMQYGLDHEQEGKDWFSLRTGIPIMSSGFYNHPRIEYFGGTPDGELDNDGLFELKVPTTATFVDWVLAGVVPEEHKPQMLGQLACTGRRYVTFAAFDPRIKKEDKRLFVRPFEPAESEIRRIEEQAEEFLAEVYKLWEAFHS